MRVSAITLFLALAMSTPVVASSDADSRGRELIARASERVNIFALSSFRMFASVHLDNRGKPIDGTYSLLWNGPDQWREQITFPGYIEIRVGDKGTIYLKRPTSYVPLQISQFRSTLDVERTVDPEPRGDEVIKKVRDEKVAGKETTCVEIARGSREKREVCANVDTGLLDRTKEGYTDSGPLPVGSKLFPRSMSLVKGGVSVVKVEITDLDTTQSAISLFEPPAGAVSKRGCMQPVPGHKVKDSVPNYPTEERLAKHEGTVEVFVVIDKSGIPQELHVVSGASPGLDKSALEAIRKWRYEPAKCDGDAVEFETNVTVRFWFE